MKRLWKQSGGLACADAGPLSPLGGRSRRRARLTLYAVAFAFAFALPPSAGAGAGASWFGGVYASTAPYRSQISSLFSSILPAPAPAPAPCPEPPHVTSGGGGSPATSPSVHGTAAKVGESSVGGSNKQSGSASGALSHAAAGAGAGHGSEVGAESKAASDVSGSAAVVRLLEKAEL